MNLDIGSRATVLALRLRAAGSDWVDMGPGFSFAGFRAIRLFAGNSYSCNSICFGGPARAAVTASG